MPQTQNPNPCGLNPVEPKLNPLRKSAVYKLPYDATLLL